MRKTIINKEPREALETLKLATANEAGPLMAFPRTPSCGGASPRWVGHGGAARTAQPRTDPRPPLGPLSCARGELARLGTELAAGRRGKSIYFYEI